jgi:GGDEF domain-containing protein
MLQAALRLDNASLLAILPAKSPPRAQLRLIEAAYAADAVPGVMATLIPLAGFAVYAVTSQAVWLVWSLLAVAAVALRVRLASAFEVRSGATDPLIWARRHRTGAWAQSAVLGLGGGCAMMSGNAAAGLLVMSSIAFMAAAQSAGASLAGTARGQALLALTPPILAGLLAGQAWAVASAAVGAAELASCIALAQIAVAHSLATSMAAVAHETSGIAAPASEPVAVEDFRRLLGRDPITGLPSRHGFMHILAAESLRAHGAAMPLSLILVSIEGLPEADEPYAQKHAQTQLSAAATAIRLTLYRVMDQMACLSPERLAILLPFTDALGADRVAHKIRDCLRTTADPSAEPDDEAPRTQVGVWAHACIGVASYGGKGLLPDTQLLEWAMEAESTARRKSSERMSRYDPLAASMRRDGEAREAGGRLALATPPMAATEMPTAVVADSVAPEFGASPF